MNRYSIGEKLPSTIRGPLRFREREGEVQGNVGHPMDLLEKFEPVDALNGAIELVDQNGLIITIQSDDQTIAENNVYPKNYAGIYYMIHEG